MQEITADVSWLGVIVGAIVAFLAGWLWYSPALFGKKWAEGVGVELGSASAMPVGAMVSQVVALLLLSWLFGITAADNTLLTIILVVLAIAAFIVSGGMFTRKSSYAVWTDAGYIVVAGIIMFIAQAVFRNVF